MEEYRTANIYDDSNYRLQYHQELTRRYLSPETMNSRLLIYGKPGIGKTCQMLVSVLYAKEAFPLVYYKRILVIIPPSQIASFKTNLSKCVPKYEAREEEEPEMAAEKPVFSRYSKQKWVDPRKSGAERKTRRVAQVPWNESKINKDFEFISHDGIVKFLQQGELDELASHRSILIDEIHFLKKKPETDPTDKGKKVFKESAEKYNLLFKFCHAGKNNIVVLSTGTPGIEASSEIDDIMNLLLPLDKQLGPQAVSESEFVQKCRGLVSYVNKPYDPSRVLQLQGETHNFSPNISEVLYKVKPTESEIKFINALKPSISSDTARQREIIMNIFPYKFETLLDEIAREKTISKKLEILKKRASKLYVYISYLIANPNHKTFLYSNYKTEGVDRIAEVLNLFGYERFDDVSLPKEKRKRYIILTGTSASTATSTSALLTSLDKNPSKSSNDSLMQVYNSPENWDGKYISTVIGSEVTNVGLSLLDTLAVFIMDGWWRYYRILQGIARIDRYNGLKEYRKNIFGAAAKDTSKKVVQQVFKLVLDYPGSVDLDQYKEAKTLYMTEIVPKLRLLKRIAYDCIFLKNTNQYPAEYNYLEECDYELCEYECSGITEAEFKKIVPLRHNYRALYQNVAKKYFSPVILDIFKTRSVASLIEIFTAIKNLSETYNPDVEMLVGVLNDYVTNKTVVLNRYGFPCTIGCEKNIYYLCESFKSAPYSSTFYNNKFIQPSNFSLDKYLHGAQKLPSLLNEFSAIETVEEFRDKLNTLMSNRKKMADIVEYAISNPTFKWANLLKTILASNIFSWDGRIFHNILGMSEIRLFNENSIWESVLDKEKEQATKGIAEMQAEKKIKRQRGVKTVTLHMQLKTVIDDQHDQNVDLIYQQGKLPLIGKIEVLDNYDFKIINKINDQVATRTNMKAIGRKHFSLDACKQLILIVLSNDNYHDENYTGLVPTIVDKTVDFSILEKQIKTGKGNEQPILSEKIIKLMEKPKQITEQDDLFLRYCVGWLKYNNKKELILATIEKILREKNYLVYV